MEKGIFAGLKVLDCASFIAAPAAATVLSDFGADVIKIEPPGAGDPYRNLPNIPGYPTSEHNFAWLLEARNKKSIALDLAKPEASPLDEAAALIEEGAFDDAQALLDAVPADSRDARYDKLLALLKLQTEPPPEGDAQALAARIIADPKDFEARFQLAALLVHAGDFSTAFEQLLEVVLRDKGATPENWREKARLQLVAWFDICPNADAVSRGRRYLGMYLN